MTTDIKEQEFPIYAYEIRKPSGSSELAYAAWFIKGYGKMMEHYAYDPLVRLADITRPATRPVQTEQPSLSDTRIYEFANAICTPTNGGWHFADGKALMLFAHALLSAQRQDSDKAEQAAMYQWIRSNVSEDMQWYLFGHVVNSPEDFDKAIRIAIANGAPK